MQYIRCLNCGRKLGEVLQGHVDVVASSNIKDIVIESEYIEKVQCRRCDKFNTKILRGVK